MGRRLRWYALTSPSPDGDDPRLRRCLSQARIHEIAHPRSGGTVATLVSLHATSYVTPCPVTHFTDASGTRPTKWGKPIRVPEKTTARMSAHPPVWKDGALGVMGGIGHPSCVFGRRPSMERYGKSHRGPAAGCLQSRTHRSGGSDGRWGIPPRVRARPGRAARRQQDGESSHNYSP